MILFIASNYVHAGIINSQLIKLAENILPRAERKIYIYGSKNVIGKNLNNTSDPLLKICFFKKFKEISRDLKNAQALYVRSYHYLFRILVIKLVFNRKLRIVYDFRGLVFMESWYRNKNVINSSILYLMEFFAYSVANDVCAVSTVLAKEINRKFYKRKINVFPCAVSTTYNKSKILNSHKEIKFVYVGSMSSWQQFDRTLKIFKYISDNIPATLTVYTNEIDKAKEQIRFHSINVVEITQLKQDEIHSRLISFDFGFLIRENQFINRVASPVKFLEYVASGVMPFITPFVGDYSNATKNYKLGYVLEGEYPDIEELKKLFNDKNIKERLFKFAIENKWENVLKNHPLNNYS